MWEVDTETKSKLLTLQRLPANTLCADCAAPSPQWASPKFGIFICLTCAGYHRGLGVHISFVRSITMDAFKAAEVRRMEVGGNEAWREFYVSKVREGGGDADWKVPPTAEVLEERYGGAVGEEWKERLSCLVEGREFSGIVKAPTVQKRRVESPAARGGRGGSPAGVGRSKKEANEAYFARMGNANSSRPEGVAPSQGGKYAGFGSAPMGGGGGEGEGEKVLPGVDEFQRDPVAALTKGFGWLSSTVGKGAKTVNEGWVKPTAQKLAESDLTLQARQTALSVSQSITTGTKGAADSLTKFIDPDRPLPNHAQSRKVEPEHRDFWDSFGAPEVKMSEGRKGGAIGTAAMRKGGIGGGGGAGKEDDKWDDF